MEQSSAKLFKKTDINKLDDYFFVVESVVLMSIAFLLNISSNGEACR